MKFLSLFTGIGGFDSGFEAAGMTNGAMCEIDRWATMVLRYHWPDVEILSDVKKINRSTLSFRPDVICGGFPCQDLSVAGKRKGMAGERSGLWFEFRRIIDEIKPAWVVVENVPGLFSSQGGRDFAVLLRGLEELGYVGAWKTFDSQYFGVAQRRRRVFIIGHLGARGRREVLFERQSLQGDPAESRKAGERVAGTISARTKGGGGLGTDTALDGGLVANETGAGFWSEGLPRLRCTTAPGQPQTIVAEIVGPLAPNCGPGSHDAGNFHCNQGVDSGHVLAITHALPARGDSSEDGTGRGTPLVPIGFSRIDNGRDATEDLTPTTMRVGTSMERSAMAGNLAVCFQQNTHDEVRKVNGDMAVRRLIPRECERLQGFRDDWTRWGRTESGEIVEISDTQRYKMLGNAVTRTVGEWIGLRIVKAAADSNLQNR